MENDPVNTITVLHYAPLIIAAISLGTLIIGGSAILCLWIGFFGKR